jgi:drug/metabolite transporter (DMT)-like permease
MAFWFPMVLAIVSYMIYHSSQKMLSNSLNPLFITSLAYSLAMLISWTLFFCIPLVGYEKSTFSWPILAIAVGVVGLDVGFLLAYRAGWGISSAPLFANVTLALAVLPIGLLIFKEKLTALNIAGVLCCVVGLILLRWGK